MTLNHSRLGSCVLAGDDDTERRDAILRILKPGKPVNMLSDNDFRDGLQLNTAIRYGGRRFITRDGNILKRSEQLFEAFQLRVMPQPDARSEVVTAIVQARRRENSRGHPMWLPEWPDPAELEPES